MVWVCEAVLPHVSTAVHVRCSVYRAAQLPLMRCCAPVTTGPLLHASAVVTPVAMAGTALHSTIASAGTPLMLGATLSCGGISWV